MSYTLHSEFHGESLIGKKFGRLTVVEFSGFTVKQVMRKTGLVNQRAPRWLCVCDCGKRCEISGNSLRSGNTKSCGCYGKEQRLKALTTHGQTGSRLHRAWSEMKTRCSNPNRTFWKRYGGRGIKVCERWESFELFNQDMGSSWFEGASLERKNLNGDYEPANCEWATTLVQANNTSKNRHVSFHGETHTVAQWARRLGINPFTLYTRLNNWTVEDAMTRPVR